LGERISFALKKVRDDGDWIHIHPFGGGSMTLGMLANQYDAGEIDPM
jgi:hypothetical protein